MNTAKIYIYHASDAVKDEASKICIASGENDVFIDMDTVEDKMPPEDKSSDTYDAVMDLREIVKMASKADAQYIHIY